MNKFSLGFLVVLMMLMVSCNKTDYDNGSVTVNTSFKTKNVVLVVIDGPRYSETWGDLTHRLVPFQTDSLIPRGVINLKFYNNGDTHTLSGHTSISRGSYEVIENTGKEYPQLPSYLQHWLYQTHADPNKAWFIGSKDKLEILGNCKDRAWSNSFLPSVNSHNRKDVETYSEILRVIDQHHPRLLFINFRGPDFGGHAKSWDMYTRGIKTTDSLVTELYRVLAADSFYSENTSFIITNDHGRHLDGIRDGFISHGDDCTGCRHIQFLAIGPDFITGDTVMQARQQIDIAPTIGHLLGFKMMHTEGEVMHEILNE